VSIAREGNDCLALADGLIYLAFLLVDRDEQERTVRDEALAVLFARRQMVVGSALLVPGDRPGRGDRSLTGA
jgi:hypothetical protein